VICPKCGADAEWIGPRFVSDYLHIGPGTLRYACGRCGFERDELTKDYESYQRMFKEMDYKIGVSPSPHWWQFWRARDV
jgi:hypothetical protein